MNSRVADSPPTRFLEATDQAREPLCTPCSPTLLLVNWAPCLFHAHPGTYQLANCASWFHHGYPLTTGKGRSAAANVSWQTQDPDSLVVVQGSEYVIEDCDLYSDSGVITSTTRPQLCDAQMNTHMGKAHCHGSSWGAIRNNRLYNGGTSHFMNQWKQMIFENNTVVGVSPIACVHPTTACLLCSLPKPCSIMPIFSSTHTDTLCICPVLFHLTVALLYSKKNAIHPFFTLVRSCAILPWP